MKRVLAAALLMVSCREAVVAPPPKQAATAEPEARRTSAPGKFDFYVLALSWSPGFCASPAGRNDDRQCGPGRTFAFVLHGLWPQYEERGWPQNCSTESLDASLIEPMMKTMPSPKLIRHEWAKHGTCSGLTSREYFEEAAEAFAKIRIPDAYQGPKRQITIKPAQMKRDFAAANPSIPEDGFSVVCSGNGRFLQEVRVCLTKDLKGRPCNREVQRGGCRSAQAIMQPLR